VLLPASSLEPPRGADVPLPFGLDAVVPAERRIEFLLVWGAIAVIASVIGYVFGSAGG